MESSELRRVWREFWAERDHTLVPSASLIPTHPTAPMFTNSGMMQFVPYFIGEEKVPYDPPRAASIQKAVRIGGKHNDLDVIGRSIRHLSFFEMLGNWSFGDYFKVEAIRWAWELVTERLGLEPDRLWVTVHVNDDEAAEIWQDEVGFPAAKIQRFDQDNFWEMGETGPCGPSSEIFLDRGPAYGPEGGPENPDAEDRFVEFWNLVFMQYFRRADGSLSDLPTRNVDTGAGFERMLMLLNGYDSLFETSVLAPVVDAVQSVSGHRVGEDEQTDRRAAPGRRPRPHHDVPRERRSHPVERGPRLRAAAHHPPGGAVRLSARRRAAGDADAHRRHRRDHGRRLPGPA